MNPALPYGCSPQGASHECLGHETCSIDITTMQMYRKSGDGQELVLTLSGPEMSDYLNFVIKDDSTGRWYKYHSPPTCPSKPWIQTPDPRAAGSPTHITAQ